MAQGYLRLGTLREKFRRVDAPLHKGEWFFHPGIAPKVHGEPILKVAEAQQGAQRFGTRPL